MNAYVNSDPWTAVCEVSEEDAAVAICKMVIASIDYVANIWSVEAAEVSQHDQNTED